MHPLEQTTPAPEPLREALEMAVDQMVASAKDEAKRRGYEYCEERCDAIVAAKSALAAPSVPAAQDGRQDVLYGRVLGIVNRHALAGHINELGVMVEACDELRAALTKPAAPAREAGSVPAGWKLVPIEPTKAMLSSAAKATFLNNGSHLEMHRRWCGFLDAAPTTPENQQ